jgi:hypothetical protein
MKQTFRYTVSFEHDTLPVQTRRGTIACGQAHTAAMRAIQDARRQIPAKYLYWSSVVVCLERQGANGGQEEQDILQPTENDAEEGA